jgi:hypothetical protein
MIRTVDRRENHVLLSSESGFAAVEQTAGKLYGLAGRDRDGVAPIDEPGIRDRLAQRLW